MNYDDFINWLNEYLVQNRRFRNIGRRRFFHARIEQQTVVFTSSNNVEHFLPLSRVELVFNRYVNAPDHRKHMSNHYSYGIWQEAPNLTTPPWMAAIIRHYEENII